MQPSITINNQTYKGEFTALDIFKGICHGFKQQPDECYGDKVWELMRYDEDLNPEPKPSIAQKTHVIAAILIAIIINLVFLFCYRRYQRKKMNEELHVQVNSAVSQYFKLAQNEDPTQKA